MVSLASTLLLVTSVFALLRMRTECRTSRAAVVLSFANWPAPFGIVLVLDRLSALMLALDFIWRSRRWSSRSRAGTGRPHFHTLFQFLLMGLEGAFLTGDLFNLFVFFEVTAGRILRAGAARLRRVPCPVGPALHRDQPGGVASLPDRRQL